MPRTDLFVIDGQHDFCDPAGALYVDGAEVEAARVAAMIDRIGDGFDAIHASLDSHPRNDCAHHTAWRNQEGNAPPPFTIVTPDDVRNHVYRPAFGKAIWEGQPVTSRQWALAYTEALERDARAPLCLWPPHCQIGTQGQTVFPEIMAAYDRLCDSTGRWIDWITKGNWPWTEHYSALRADVPDSTQPQTQMNAGVIQEAAKADVIVWCGWAGSHCLKWTAEDGVNFFEPTDDEKAAGAKNEFIAKCVFLEDACAAVPNVPGGPDFAQWREDFLADMDARGATISTTTDFAP